MSFSRVLLATSFVTVLANALTISTSGEFKDCFITKTADSDNGVSTSVTLNSKTITVALAYNPNLNGVDCELALTPDNFSTLPPKVTYSASPSGAASAYILNADADHPFDIYTSSSELYSNVE